MKRVVYNLSFLLLCIILQSTPSFAQYGSYWKKIGQLPSYQGYKISGTAGYFWNKNSGLVGAVRTLGDQTSGDINTTDPFTPRIFYTTNGGANWIESNTPYSSIPHCGWITSI